LCTWALLRTSPVQTIQQTQKTFALISTFFSMASIIGGVHHLWKHRPKSDIDSEETVSCPGLSNQPRRFSLNPTPQPRYLDRAIGKLSRITFTSVFLCLPLVFLLWSVISFAIALMHFAFRTNRGIDLGFLVTVVAVILFVTFSVRVFFYRIWEEQDSTPILERIWNPFRTLIARARDAQKTSAVASTSRVQRAGETQV